MSVKGQSTTLLPGMVYVPEERQSPSYPPAAPATTTTPTPSPWTPRPRTARIIGPDNGFGLSRDRTILREILQTAGWEVTLLDTSGRVTGAVALQVHLEAPAADLLGAAPDNVLIPHPEWWKADWTPLLKRPGVRVWAKTADGERIFRDIGARVERIGWRSLDRHDPAVPRQRTFLHVAGQSAQKGTEVLLSAWRPGWPRLTVVTTRPIPGRPNVDVIEHVSDEELRRLQNAHAFHVYPSCYEGWGHAQQEGLSCGAVVFATEGPPFDEHPEVFRLLRSRPARRALNGLVEGREVLTEAIGEAVRWAVFLSEDDLAAESERSRRAWERTTAAFAERLPEVLAAVGEVVPSVHAPAAVRRLVAIHSPHERCGIAEYGRQLDAALSAAGTAPLALTYAVPADDLLAAVGPGTTILAHFEPSLLPSGYEQALAEARWRGARVVLCCHWFEPSLLSTYGPIVDRFVVHRPYGAEEDGRIAEIPLGCPEYDAAESRADLRRRLGLPADRLVLTTIGFLAGWKRIPGTLDALLRRLPPGVFLQVLTPHPFSGAEENEEAQVREVLARHGAGSDRVLFSTEFRPDRDLLDRVHASDAGFLYHGQHTGSVSAATKSFVSGRTPLIATASTHASDLREGVARVDSFDLDAFAAEVARVTGDNIVRADLRAGMEREYERLRMGAIARRYLDLFEGLR